MVKIRWEFELFIYTSNMFDKQRLINIYKIKNIKENLKVYILINRYSVYLKA